MKRSIFQKTNYSISIIASACFFSLFLLNGRVNAGYISRPPSDTDLSPRICKQDSDCIGIGKECGDFACLATKISCVSGLCCGSNYSFRDRQVMVFAPSEDTEHLKACSEKIASYKNPEYCGIFLGDIRDQCRNKALDLSAFDNDNYKLCNDIKNDEVLRDHCFSMVSKKMLAPEVCNNVKNLNERDECLSFVYRVKAYETNDASLCKEIPNTYLDAKDKCRFDLAKKTGDRKICEDVSSKEMMIEGDRWNQKDNCKKWASVTAMDYKYCLSIDMPEQRWRCIWFIAAETSAADLENNCKKLLNKDFDEKACYEKLVSICNLLGNEIENCSNRVRGTFKIYNDPEIKKCCQ